MVKTHIQEVLPEAVTVQPGLLPTAPRQVAQRHEAEGGGGQRRGQPARVHTREDRLPF